MKRWHRDAGITPRGASRADEALPLVMTALELLGGDTVALGRVLREATFRVCELPTRSAEFQLTYIEQAETEVDR